MKLVLKNNKGAEIEEVEIDEHNLDDPHHRRHLMFMIFNMISYAKFLEEEPGVFQATL